jgi:exodeoxyribonuclease V gamma subunit
MIRVHRSARADRLVEALGDLLLEPLVDPMAAEIVAVPSRGVERWLAQRLAHRLGAGANEDGVCANVEFPFPGSVVEGATSAACGFDPDADPWPPDRSVWPLLELVDEHLAEPWLGPLAVHLEAGSPTDTDGPGELRRFATVRRLADLFDRYAVHRPEMVQRWAQDVEGAGQGRSAARNGTVTDDHWQAELWRRLRRRLGVPSPAERLVSATTRIVEAPDLLALPSRLSLFGLTRLPASHLQVLEAVGRHRDVHLFLLHPSEALWRRVAEVAGSAGAQSRRRCDDPTAHLPVNALLRSWGRDAREMQLVLQSRGLSGGEFLALPEPALRNQTLLQRLQADVRADRRPPGPPRLSTEADGRPPLDPDDDSVQVHACHGRLRQVEVMRDAILHLLADDQTLEPRDVVVMCPDIDSFAPLVDAVFRSSDRTDGLGAEGERNDPELGMPRIRVRLADRAIRQTNPILAVAAQLLALGDGRVTASEVLDLAGRDPVARRFGFNDDELSQLERWVVESGIRWGFDREHRGQWRLDQVGDNTWRAGLDRLLLGVAMAEEDQRLFGGVLPVDDVSSGSVDLAGRLTEFVERLRAAVDSLQGRHTVGDWVAAIREATESLALAAPNEEWQHDELRRMLGKLEQTATTRARDGSGETEPSEVVLDLSEIRSVLDDRLRGQPTWANFRTGDLTVCTLVPMRSVPHRVIGLLGLDDGAFPRNADRDGDDLLLAEPHVGDRDPRAEDRQLLLDALLAATDHLVITYEGRDPRTNQVHPPCVPVAELLDVVDRTVQAPVGSAHRSARAHVVVEHPLQSFDWRNFSAGQIARDGPWGFDSVDLSGAIAHAKPPTERRPFLARPLPRLDAEVVQLDALVRFLEHPVRAFVRERLGWYGGAGGPQVKDELPVELDALERWQVGERMLEALLRGASADGAALAEQGRGLLPPGTLAGRQLREIETMAASLAKAAEDAIGTAIADPQSVEVHVRLPDGRSLIGTVPDVHDVGSRRDGASDGQARILRCSYSRLGPKHRLAAWARFLALTAAHPELAVSAVTIGRSPAGNGYARSTLATMDGTPRARRTLALDCLVSLVDLYDRGLSEPLPLYARTSEKYADAVRRDRDVRIDCRSAWKFDRFTFGEAGEPEHVLVLGGITTVEDLLTTPPTPDEDGPGWSQDPSRFGRLARRLWEPLLAHERMERGS